MLTMLGLLTLALVGASSASATCSGAPDQRCTYPDASSGPIQAGGTVDCAAFAPGLPSGGTLGFAQWFAKADAYTACTAAGAAQDVALQQVGDVAWTGGVLATGAAGLANAGGVSAGALAYESNLAVAAASQAHDTCFVALGGTCGADPPVSRAQTCPSGVALPSLFPGSLTGYTLDNANQALQSTCAFGGIVEGIAPTPAQVAAFAGGAQTAIGGQATATAGALTGLSGTAFGAGSALLDNVCVWLTGATPCT
jgi:hypothetical protein